MKKVFAVIVTFRRPEVLRRCLEHLVVQKKFADLKIHVVVNSSDEETQNVVNDFVIKHPGMISHERHDNAGPAGGFYFGLKRFLESRSDFAWLMDDDVVVRDNALEEMLKHGDAGYVYPKVMKGSGEEVVSFGWWGVLLSREVVLRAGLPLPELFYWAEDTEYLQNRIKRVNGIEPVRARTAVVEHMHHRASTHPSWYFYYTVRNSLYYRHYILGFTVGRLAKTWFFYIRTFGRILLKEDHKFKKYKMMLRATIDGLRKRTGKLVDPAQNS